MMQILLLVIILSISCTNLSTETQGSGPPANDQQTVNGENDETKEVWRDVLRLALERTLIARNQIERIGASTEFQPIKELCTVLLEEWEIDYPDPILKRPRLVFSPVDEPLGLSARQPPPLARVLVRLDVNEKGNVVGTLVVNEIDAPPAMIEFALEKYRLQRFRPARNDDGYCESSILVEFRPAH